jgi:hypothetical protein
MRKVITMDGDPHNTGEDEDDGEKECESCGGKGCDECLGTGVAGEYSLWTKCLRRVSRITMAAAAEVLHLYARGNSRIAWLVADKFKVPHDFCNPSDSLISLDTWLRYAHGLEYDSEEMLEVMASIYLSEANRAASEKEVSEVEDAIAKGMLPDDTYAPCDPKIRMVMGLSLLLHDDCVCHFDFEGDPEGSEKSLMTKYRETFGERASRVVASQVIGLWVERKEQEDRECMRSLR